MLPGRSAVFLSVVVIISMLPIGAGEEPDPSRPAFKAKAQLVLLDVTASGATGHPITGLQRDDFEIFENGQGQIIASFEEHQEESRPAITQRLPLPPHVFTNAPLEQSPGSINVLLLDSLNTELSDQATVRLQMIDYLRTIDPGPQLSIFTLASQLRLVEGFTSNPKSLVEALNHKQWRGVPRVSSQQISAPDNLDQAALAKLTESGTVEGEKAAIEAIQDFLAEAKATEPVTRMSATLHALQALSLYLSGFQGRKNIIWFSGSFPQIDFPARGELTRIERNDALSEELRDTVNMLAGAQIAVYPIAAQGLETQRFYEAASPSSGRANGVQSASIEGQNQSLTNENINRYINHKAADDIASNTGGQAFYNTNGLKEALAEAVHRGAYYYRLSYSPTDKTTQGRWRHIEVRLKKQPRATNCKLAYRRGYYEENEKRARAVTAGQSADPLQPFMRRGLPDATELTYNLRLFRSRTQPNTDAAPLGDKKELRGPMIRVAADFVIPLGTFDFELTSDGVRHGNLELALVAYDRAGEPLNWIFRPFRTSLKSDVYPSVQKTGIEFHEELDVPTMDDLYLRTGIYDLRSNKVGTLEIPLSGVTMADVVPTGIQKPAALASPTPLGLPLQTEPVDNRATNSGIKVSTAPETPHHVPQLSSPPFEKPSAQDPNNIAESIDAPTYCPRISPSIAHSSALANVCEFALSMRKQLPNLICERQMKRYWTEYRATWQGGNGVGAFDEVKHSDLLTAKVTYRDGMEFYDDLRVDGKLVSPEASVLPPSSLSGPWSMGEFAMVLEAVFLPSSKTEFQFKKQTHVGSATAFVFGFHIEATNNRSYFLFANDKEWFPEYGGELWIDENGSRLLRLRRQTAYMDRCPIRSVQTDIEYAPVPLADGSSIVLPINSQVMTCTPPARGNSDNCSRSLVKFTNWHKFRATTKIVSGAEH